jgi:hypothetical protein
VIRRLSKLFFMVRIYVSVAYDVMSMNHLVKMSKMTSNEKSKITDFFLDIKNIRMQLKF